MEESKNDTSLLSFDSYFKNLFYYYFGLLYGFFMNIEVTDSMKD